MTNPTDLCPYCGSKKHPSVNGLTSNCFLCVRTALKKLPKQDGEHALACLAEIGCQITQLDKAKRKAENDLHELSQNVDKIRQELHTAHVDFGGRVDDLYDDV